MREDYHNHEESRLVQERYLQVLSPAGEVLYAFLRGTGLLTRLAAAETAARAMSQRDQRVQEAVGLRP